MGLSAFLCGLANHKVDRAGLDLTDLNPKRIACARCHADLLLYWAGDRWWIAPWREDYGHGRLVKNGKRLPK